MAAGSKCAGVSKTSAHCGDGPGHRVGADDFVAVVVTAKRGARGTSLRGRQSYGPPTYGGPTISSLQTLVRRGDKVVLGALT